ncbi:MAG: hypothetical protein Q8P12_01975 [bacterium]|nr:hypothetical protein [bacterium]
MGKGNKGRGVNMAKQAPRSWGLATRLERRNVKGKGKRGGKKA